MHKVAIVTDSASDLEPSKAQALGIHVVPLEVSFGDQRYKAGLEMTNEAFWARMTSPEAPFPKTAASSPGDFQAVYQKAFDDGADAIISIHVAGTLSGTLKSAQVAASAFPGREIHLVDSQGASMAEGLLCELALHLAREGVHAAEIKTVLEERVPDIGMYVALDTVEYLRRGGRISGAQAAIGTLLSVKPIVKVAHGAVETVDKVRTRGKARERLIEIVCTRPMERLSVLHTTNADVEAFVEEIVARVPGGIDRSKVTVDLVGPSVGPHLGPGCVGAVCLYATDDVV